MRNGFFGLLVSTIFLVLVLLPSFSSGQTSIGYTDTDDISNLLNYRLPDWSYRVWDAELDLNGSGTDTRRSGSVGVANRFSTKMMTHYFQGWESEQRQMGLSIQLSGDYSQSHSGFESYEYKAHNLGGEYSVYGRWEQYLAESPFALLFSGWTRRSYLESIYDSQSGDGWIESSNYERTARQQVFAGLGFGRLRNVVPLLRAQRLSERLVALDRRPLTPQQIHDLAKVLATEYGYRRVFDRSDRHFWDDVLSPLLDESNPLNPYEVFYLADILNEDIGDRYEGFRARAGFSYSDGSLEVSENTGDNHNSRSRTPRVDLSWYHNLSLSQQIMISSMYSYSWSNNDSDSRNRGFLALTAGHLWNLADRINLNTDLGYRGYNWSYLERDDQHVSLASNLDFFLEDQVSLNLGAECRYSWSKDHSEEDISWSWNYQLGLKYHLDRIIF